MRAARRAAPRPARARALCKASWLAYCLGDLEGQARLAEERRAENAQRAAKPGSARSRTEKPRTLTFKERKELTELEARIAELEARQSRLNAELSSGAQPYDAMQRLGEELVTTGEHLEQAFERWAELAAIAEATG